MKSEEGGGDREMGRGGDGERLCERDKGMNGLALSFLFLKFISNFS